MQKAQLTFIVTIATVIMISRFCAKAHLLFHWCLYNNVNLITFFSHCKVGMDKNIASLSVPLGQLKEEVLVCI